MDNSVAFEAVHDLLDFLTACEQGSGAQGLRSEDYETVFVERDPKRRDPDRYVVNSGQWDGKGLLYGGKFRAGVQPNGERVPINRLLEMIPLKPWKRHPTSVELVALVCEIRDGTDEARAQELVHDTWLHIPRTEDSETTFMLAGEAAQARWMIACVSGVDPSFDAATFRERHPGIKLFLPAWSDTEGDCFFYVAWGYEYLFPYQCYYLYREIEGSVVLAMPQSGAPDRDGLVPAHVVTVEGSQAKRSGDIRKLEFPSDQSFETVEYEESDPPGLPPLPIRQGSRQTSIAVRGDLDRKIGVLQRRLDTLNQQRARLRDVSGREFLAVHVFDPPSDENAGVLPAKLIDFLIRALGELSSYTYLRVEQADGKQTSHCIIGQVASSRSQVLAVNCDRTYLCDTRWDTWGLPLYVRTDCGLNVDLAEEDSCRRLREYFEERAVHVSSHVVLADPVGDKPTEGEEFLLTKLGRGEALNRLLHFTNEAGRGGEFIKANAEEVPRDGLCNEFFALLDNVKNVDEKLREHAMGEIACLETDWENARQTIHQAAIRARLTSQLSAAATDACEPFPATWQSFLDKVAVVSKGVARALLSEHKKLDTEHQQALEDLKKLEDALGNVEERCKTLLSEQQQKLRDFVEQKRRLDRALPEILKQHKIASAKREQVVKAWKGLRKKEAAVRAHTAKLEVRLRKLEKTKKKLKAALEKLEARRKEETAKNNEAKKLLRSVNGERKLIHELGAETKKLLAEIAAGRSRVSSDIQPALRDCSSARKKARRLLWKLRWRSLWGRVLALLPKGKR